MQTGTSEVKSKGKVVGEAKFPIFDSIEEAVQQLGEKDCVDLLNSQVKTNEQNTIRAEKTGKPSKAAITQKAVLSITAEELQGCIGDQDKLSALIASKEAEIRAELGMDDEA